MGFTAMTPIVLGLGGYLFTYYNTKITEERKAQIERVNLQVKSLYGPLLACVTASKSAFDAMVTQHSPNRSVADFMNAARLNPNGPEGQTYRQWMKEVLQPLNEKAANIVTSNADLLEASSMEPLLLQLVAHVSAYKVILSRWEQGDSAEWSAISYPDKLLEYCEREFKQIKARQAFLLGIKNGGIRAKL
ncbi:hypothetical protein WJX72_000464 [[Myrmecia] bisecta]|uniref:Uncharacterized protein n=1 Tax=[Myrmecia] bisecta TaxID=41462 RepID=A0AAW1Q6D0_9CHLO